MHAHGLMDGRASSTTDYLAITVLLIQALMVLVHIANLLFHGKFSSCWDSLTELLH